jgi:hypothetical protein
MKVYYRVFLKQNKLPESCCLFFKFSEVVVYLKNLSVYIFKSAGNAWAKKSTRRMKNSLSLLYEGKF